MKNSPGNDGIPLRWRAAAALVLVVGLVHPEGGTRALCPSRVLWSRPCGLCGLTRSVSAVCRGDLRGGWELHPLGVVAVVVAAAVLLAHLLPGRISGRAVRWWMARRRVRLGLGLAVLLWVVALGAVRWSQHGHA